MSRRAIPLAMSPRTFLLPLAAAAVLLPAGLRADPTEPANAVTVEKVASISITGAGNEIQWSKALDGERPQVTDQGKTNRITHPGG